MLPRALGHMLSKADGKTRAAVNKVIRVSRQGGSQQGWCWSRLGSSALQARSRNVEGGREGWPGGRLAHHHVSYVHVSSYDMYVTVPR